MQFISPEASIIPQSGADQQSTPQSAAPSAQRAATSAPVSGSAPLFMVSDTAAWQGSTDQTAQQTVNQSGRTAQGSGMQGLTTGSPITTTTTTSQSGTTLTYSNLHGLLHRAGARQIIIRARHEAASKRQAMNNGDPIRRPCWARRPRTQEILFRTG